MSGNVALVVDYGMGNVASVVNMARAAGGHAMVSNSADEIVSAKKLILPGVGAFDKGMDNLDEQNLIEPLRKAVLDLGTPILGICLGMQLVGRRSEEGKRDGLGWIQASTVRFNFPLGETQLRVPHMGWNNMVSARHDPLLRNLPDDSRFYFVHSLHLVCDHETDVTGWTTYGYRFPSVIRHKNIFGVQFHPEKSHKFGMAIIRNFLELM